MTTSIWSGVKLKSHLASIISSPLFIRVAESMVIFAPIFQLGCCNAWSLFTFTRKFGFFPRNGPPLAVKIIFSILFLCFAHKALKNGRMFTIHRNYRRPFFPTPFASQYRLPLPVFLYWPVRSPFPFSTAFKVGFNPAKPTIAASIIS